MTTGVRAKEEEEVLARGGVKPPESDRAQQLLALVFVKEIVMTATRRGDSAIELRRCHLADRSLESALGDPALETELISVLRRQGLVVLDYYVAPSTRLANRGDAAKRALAQQPSCDVLGNPWNRIPK